LIQLQAAVSLPLAVARQYGDFNFLAGLRGGLSVRNSYFDLPQQSHDLLRLVQKDSVTSMLGHTSITMTMRYVHLAAEQNWLASAKVVSFRINGLIEAASEQAVGTNMGTVAWVN
jgi:hypothetical protein